MYDNRRTKKNPKQPDFRCKDENCTDEKGFRTGVWVEKSEPTPRNGNGRPTTVTNIITHNKPQPNPLLSPAQFIAASAKVLASCHAVAGQAGLKDPEDARSIFIACQRAGIIETVGAKMTKPAPKPEPEPEPEPTTDEGYVADPVGGDDIGLDL